MTRTIIEALVKRGVAASTTRDLRVYTEGEIRWGSLAKTLSIFAITTPTGVDNYEERSLLFMGSPPPSIRLTLIDNPEIVPTRPGGPTIIKGAVAIRGALSKVEIKRAMNKAAPAVRVCYEKSLLKKPKLAGRVDLMFTVGKAGKVTKVEITKETLGDKKVTSCISRVIKKTSFPAPRGGGVVIINYPFVFKTN